MPVPAPSPSTTPGCTPTTSLLRFDGGYEVSTCYVTPDGVAGEAKAGLYASAESGLLWFFSRENAEVLVKVLNGCAINGYRWVFVAPVTTLEFDLQVTSPTGARWNHTNTQGVTAATKSDVAAFSCADEPETAPDLIVSSSVSDANPATGELVELQATARNRGDAPAWPTTLALYQSDDSTISTEDLFLASTSVPALAASATVSWSLRFSYSVPVTYYLGACVDSVPGELNPDNNCSDGVQVVVREPAPDLTVSDFSVSDENPAPGQTIALRAVVLNQGDGPAGAGRVFFLRADELPIDGHSDELGNKAVPALAASATESRTLDFTVPSTAGAFYLGACSAGLDGELDLVNNCSDGVHVVVE